MKIRTCIFAVVILLLSIGPQVRADSTSSREYQVKAAFLYNFIMFVDWPPEKMPDAGTPIIIGIIGKDPFGDAFEPIKDKQVKDRKVIVKRFKGLEELKKAGEAELNQTIEIIRKCHLLFVCSSEKNSLREIFDLVKDYNVLTVGDTGSFLDGGGIINFVTEEGKVRFEINDVVANQAKLEIRSQLLRLATRVIEDKTSQEAKD